MTPYSKDKFPPSPVLNLRLSFPEESAKSDEIPALIDTGSDFTLVPLRYLLDVEAPEMRTASVRGMFSQSHAVTIYLVDIHLEIGLLPGVEVIDIDDGYDDFDSGEIILGRNVINKLYLYLDGPAEQIHLLERPPRRF